MGLVEKYVSFVSTFPAMVHLDPIKVEFEGQDHRPQFKDTGGKRC